MRFFKEFAVRYQLRQAIRQAKDQRRSTVPYHQANYVGIIVEASTQSDIQAAMDLADRLRREGKDVHILALIEKPKELAIPAGIAAFGWKEIGWNGQVQSEAVRFFAGENFDYLYYLCHTAALPLELLLAQSQAKCRIGKHLQKPSQVLELSLAVSGETLTAQALRIWEMSRQLLRRAG